MEPKCRNAEKTMNRIKRLSADRRGVTLIEMVVSFALLGIFLVVCAQVLASGLSLYQYVKARSYGKQVADTLMEKITGEIEGAQTATGVSFVPGTEGEGDGSSTLSLAKDGTYIILYDRTGSRIRIGTETVSGRDIVNLHYYQVNSIDSENNEVVSYEAVDWQFDPAVYMGYEVESLRFTRPWKDHPSDYEQNIIQVELCIKNPEYGSEYKIKRLVRCFNFTPLNYNKIQEVEVAAGDGE